MKTKLSIETARKMYQSNDESIKAFALDNYTIDELKKREINKWSDLDIIEGYVIDKYANITPIKAFPIGENKINRNIYATLKQTESSIAMAQLSQLMKHEGIELNHKVELDVYLNSCKNFDETEGTVEIEINFTLNYYFYKKHEKLFKTWLMID